MPANYGRHFSILVTPQSQPIPGREADQVANGAGGFSFPVNDWTRLERFLILGCEGGSYYAAERTLTIENAGAVVRCLNEDPARTIRTIAEISHAGRAPKNDPALFALAIAAGHKDPAARALALKSLPAVARIPTHLFAFMQYIKAFRGRGHGLKKALANWYLEKPIDQLAYQVAKYQRRNGWSHRDVLRISHPRTEDPTRQAVLRWSVGGKKALGSREVQRSRGGPAESQPDLMESLPPFLEAVEQARTADVTTISKLILDQNLPRECIPTERLNDPDVWGALLVKMPIEAMVRNLGKMTDVGLLEPMAASARIVCDRLADQEYIKQSRLHPLAILMAAKVYAQGHGEKGKLSWTPVSQINDALDAAFGLAFGNVRPAGKRTLVGLDVSGSMSDGQVAGTPLTPREAAAALALVMARTEPYYQVMAFQDRFVPLDIPARSSLTEVVHRTEDLSFGRTDCSLPMVWALEQDVSVDTFIVITDSETWVGNIHACQALVQYRRKTGIPARLIVTALVSNGFSIADPNDAGMLDVVGMDTAAPEVMRQFSAGEF